MIIFCNNTFATVLFLKENTVNQNNSNPIYYPSIDSEGLLWISSEEDILIDFGTVEEMNSFIYNNTKSVNATKGIFEINKKLFITVDILGNVYIINKESLVIQKLEFENKEQFSSNTIKYIEKINENFAAIIFNKDIAILNTLNNALKLLPFKRFNHTFVKSSQLVILSENSLFFYDHNTSMLNERKIPIIKQQEVQFIIKTKHEYLAGINSTIFKLDNELNYPKVTFFKDSNNCKYKRKYKKNAYFDLLKKTDKYIWFASNCSIYLFDLENNKFRNKQFGDSEWYIASFNKKEEILVFEDGALYQIDTNMEVESKFHFLDKKELNSPYVQNWYRAFKTKRQGIVALSKYRSWFYNFNAKEKVNTQINIRSIYKDKKGNLYIGTQLNGAFKLNPKDNIINQFNSNSEEPSLKNNHVRDIVQLKPNEIWFISEYGGVQKYIQNKSKWLDYTHQLPTNEVFGSFEDRDKRLWINHKKGVSVKGDENFINYSDNDVFGKLGAIRAIEQDARGIMWFGSHKKGLYRFDEKNNNWQIFSHDENNTKSISHDYIFSLHSDKKDRLWIGTWGGGLDYFDQKNNRFIHYTKADGLPSNVVFGILEDESGYLWFSTLKGLVHFKPCEDINGNVTKSCKHFIRVFDKRDGLIIDEFDSESYYKAPNGDMYFGGLGGFIRFNPETDIKFNDIPPKNIIFTSLSVNGKKQHPSDSIYIEKAINYVDKIKLNYDDILIKFEFAALDYVLPEKNQYKYRLNGGDWVHLGTERSVTFTQLKPGEYLFEVLGSNNDGVWALAPKKVKIIIAAPWYQTNFAFILYSITIIIGIWLFIVYKQKRLKKINVELEQTVNTRTQELAKALDDKQKLFENISHEFRTPLTLILGPVEQLLKLNHSQEFSDKLFSIQNNGERLLYLVEQLLSLAEVRAHKPQIKTYELYELTKRVVKGFEAIAKENNLTINLTNLPTTLTIELIEQSWEIILTNLLSNAIKHSPKDSSINVSLSYFKNELTLRVVDQGEGINEDKLALVFKRFYKLPNNTKQGSGIGLALTKELVESMNGKVSVSNIIKGEKITGCEFLVRLPYETKAPIETKTENIKTEGIQSLEPQFTGTVLLVEDDPELQNYIKGVLSDIFSVKTANNGKQALKQIAKSLPDIIISDVMMPEMNGFELAESIKNNNELKHIPLILLTAKDDLQSQKRGFKAKVDDYMGKPFSSEILLMKVTNLLKSFQAYKAHIKSNFYRQNFDLEELASKDKQFMQKFDQALNEMHRDSKIKIDQIANHINMDKRTLARYCERLLSQTPSQALKEYRLTRAMDMLKKGYTVTQTSFDCGFSSVAYFGSCFKQQFGEPPSSFVSS